MCIFLYCHSLLAFICMSVLSIILLTSFGVCTWEECLSLIFEVVVATVVWGWEMIRARVFFLRLGA